MVSNERVNLITSIVKGLLIEGHIKPSEFMSGVHNAFVHGKLLEEAGYSVQEKHLVSLFNGFDISIEALRQMEESN